MGIGIRGNGSEYYNRNPEEKQINKELIESLIKAWKCSVEFRGGRNAADQIEETKNNVGLSVKEKLGKFLKLLNIDTEKSVSESVSDLDILKETNVKKTLSPTGYYPLSDSQAKQLDLALFAFGRANSELQDIKEKYAHKTGIDGMTSGLVLMLDKETNNSYKNYFNLRNSYAEAGYNVSDFDKRSQRILSQELSVPPAIDPRRNASYSSCSM